MQGAGRRRRRRAAGPVVDALSPTREAPARRAHPDVPADYCDAVTASAAPVALASTRRRAVRSARPARLRRASEAVLVAGSVLAVAAAFGPAWAARAGVGIAVVAAVLACVFAWRELFTAERSHAASVLTASQRHGAQLRTEREHNASVVATLSGRVREATGVVEGQRVTIAGLRHQVFALEGDRTTLRGQLAQRDKVISWLRSTVRSQDAQIAVLRTQLQVEEDERAAAEVHRLPRRVRAEFAAVEESDVTELPTFAAVLPNYEVDRRLG